MAAAVAEAIYIVFVAVLVVLLLVLLVYRSSFVEATNMIYIAISVAITIAII